MNKRQSTENKTLNIFKLLIGLLIASIGMAHIISKTTYTFRGFDKVEGAGVQAIGIIEAICGAYLIFSAVKGLLKQSGANQKK